MFRFQNNKVNILKMSGFPETGGILLFEVS